MTKSQQAEVNIGLVGHVDHGKTTIVKSLTGVWADTHSEEQKRGITIRLGYADVLLEKSGRRVAFVDAPGHETLMTVMISGAAIMDGAMLVIAANEKCPQPQTYEHLMALDIVGVKNIIIVQNKVDLVTKEEAMKNYQQIKEFVKGTIAEDAPIIPLAAHHKLNLDALIDAIEEYIPTPKRDLKKPVRMFIARSFDINKPGTPIEKLKGGVIGGSIVQGKITIGESIEIRPGIHMGDKWEPVVTEVTGLNTCGKSVKEAVPGGLIGVATMMDPALTKTDLLVGNIAGKAGELPPVLNEMEVKLTLMERMVGADKVEPPKMNEPVVVSVGTATTIGMVQTTKPLRMKLKRPICAEKGWKASISRRIGNRWRLIGYGTIA